MCRTLFFTWFVHRISCLRLHFAFYLKFLQFFYLSIFFVSFFSIYFLIFTSLTAASGGNSCAARPANVAVLFDGQNCSSTMHFNSLFCGEFCSFLFNFFLVYNFVTLGNLLLLLHLVFFNQKRPPIVMS